MFFSTILHRSHVNNGYKIYNQFNETKTNINTIKTRLNFSTETWIYLVEMTVADGTDEAVFINFNGDPSFWGWSSTGMSLWLYLTTQYDQPYFLHYVSYSWHLNGWCNRLEKEKTLKSSSSHPLLLTLLEILSHSCSRLRLTISVGSIKLLLCHASWMSVNVLHFLTLSLMQVHNCVSFYLLRFIKNLHVFCFRRVATMVLNPN